MFILFCKYKIKVICQPNKKRFGLDSSLLGGDIKA
jgi:hypothetical protein